MNMSETQDSSNSTESAIYSGWIRHRRFEPIKHSFTYPIFMLYLDLDEISTLFRKKWYCSVERFNVVSFKRQDFFKPEQESLKQSVIDHVTEYYQQENVPLDEITSVRMLCHVRYLGFVFNPVVFYYCFDSNNQLVAILAEITNTPWGERHSYVLPVLNHESFEGIGAKLKGHNAINKKYQFDFKKQFHVSPFNPMNMDYSWVFSEAKDDFIVHMNNFIQSNEANKHFDATLNMQRHDLLSKLARILLKQPLMTVKVMVGIYWQAFKLWVKGSKFYDHPETLEVASQVNGSQSINIEQTIEQPSNKNT